MNIDATLHMTKIGLRSYRAAISLSNIGINMLQRHCYTEATATFRDALELMRDAAGQPSAGGGLEDEKRMNFLLQESSRRFAEVFSNSKRASSSAFAPLIVLGDDFNSDFVRTALKEPSSNNREAVAIRIDDRKEIDCDARFQFDSAIILFNYATATRCLSVAIPSSPMILQAAYKSFHMSYGVLTKIKNSKSAEDDLLSIRVHLIAMLAVQHLALSAVELQMLEKAQEHYNLLCGLKAMYKRIERIPHMLNAAKSVAPAA